MAGKVEERVLQFALIKLLTGNIRGLYPRFNQNRIPLLQDITKTQKLPLIALTETHLHSDIKDAEVQIQDYELFRTDRKGRSHGGVAIYLEKILAVNSEILMDYSNDTNEILALYIITLNLVVTVLYRSPNATRGFFEEVICRLRYLLENLPSPNTEIMILDDFNFPHLNWDSHEVTGGTREEKLQAGDLLTLMENSFLTQFIKNTIRESNILDLVLSNNHGIIHKYILTETAMSDHKLCEITVYINAV